MQSQQILSLMFKPKNCANDYLFNSRLTKAYLFRLRQCYEINDRVFDFINVNTDFPHTTLFIQLAALGFII